MKRELLVSLDMAELTVRMVEAGMMIKRPEGSTPVEVMKTLPEEMENCFHRAARAAADYFGEQMQEAWGPGNFRQADIGGAAGNA